MTMTESDPQMARPGYVDRTLDLQQLVEHKSCFLFGPR
jgi:hypothetical protein